MKSEENLGRGIDTHDVYHVRWLSSAAEMDEAASLWLNLDARSSAEFVGFQSFEWCRNWIENHGHSFAKPRVLMLQRGQQAVAILPLMQTSASFGIGLMQMLGAPHTQYANVLTAEGRLSATEVKILREALQKSKGVDAAVFNYVPEDSPLAFLLSKTAPSQTMANASAQFDLASLPNGQPFESTLSKDKQREMRKKLRKLESEAGYSLETLRPGMAEYRCAIETCIAMKSEWLQETAKVGASLAYDGHARFLASIAQSENSKDGPYVWVMKSGGKPIAIELGMLQRGHYYAYMGAFDWNMRKLSPGKLLMCHVINTLRDMGARKYDLLANPTDYKKDYSNQSTQLTGHVINLTSRGTLYTKVWTEWLKPNIRHLFYSLPTGLRQNLATMHKLNPKNGA
jgi:CelD/BcsL family acetyltransferase involved in cellulose biosynthesis